MKTKIISTLKKELLIIETNNVNMAWAMIFNEWGSKEVLKWTILGTPDEIKEDVARELVESWESVAKDGTRVYDNYKNGIPKKRTALESFNSALESEIYWDVNPLKYWFENADKIDDENEAIAKKQFDEAELRTFDKKRILIFVKN